MKTFGKVWLGIGLMSLVFGIGLLIIAAASGASWSDIPTYSKDESYDNVKALDVKISYGKVIIEEGDGFSIHADRLIDEGFESYVSNGTWVIKEEPEDYNELFGMRLPMRQILQWNHEFVPEITITVPKDFVADNISLEIGAGTVTADVIKSVDGNFTVGAGELTINQLLISGESNYKIGTGHMYLEQIEAKDVTVNCGVGYIEMDGIITGDNDVSCGIGGVHMNLSGNEEDYSYIISALGEVSINGESYHNLSDHRIVNKGSNNNFTIDCGIGDISVDFN